MEDRNQKAADGRKAGGEALTGEYTGPVPICAIRNPPTPLSETEGHIEGGTTGSRSQTRSRRPCGLCGNFSSGYWEITRAPEGDGPSSRSEKAPRPTSDMRLMVKEFDPLPYLRAL